MPLTAPCQRKQSAPYPTPRTMTQLSCQESASFHHDVLRAHSQATIEEESGFQSSNCFPSRLPKAWGECPGISLVSMAIWSFNHPKNKSTQNTTWLLVLPMSFNRFSPGFVAKKKIRSHFASSDGKIEKRKLRWNLAFVDSCLQLSQATTGNPTLAIDTAAQCRARPRALHS